MATTIEAIGPSIPEEFTGLTANVQEPEVRGPDCQE
jgi:hypothetical protein